MTDYSLPYGKSNLTFSLPDNLQVDVIAPVQTPAALDPVGLVNHALLHPAGGSALPALSPAHRAAIAINDKTRPVPHRHLLPPLLTTLEAMGLSPEQITLVIATGAHPPMRESEFAAVVPQEILNRYPVVCHNADDTAALHYLGETSRDTPVWINAEYLSADLRLVVGNIEPHQFQGFSGGVKSAAIGLAGRTTINHNHALMTDAFSALGEFERNPARQDVEEIGAMIGIHFALNAVLNDHKEIVHVLAGDPRAVMAQGIPLARRICQVKVAQPYDLIIASPGGHPKDINLYQAQKGLAHACLIAAPGATVIIAAACPEGTGSPGYEAWMAGMRNHAQVLERFAAEGFRIGPHKAFQISRDASRFNVHFLSQIEASFAERLLLNPISSLQPCIDAALARLSAGARVAVMPIASATIPYIEQSA